MKVLVLGNKGILGNNIFQALLSRYPETTCKVARPLGKSFYQRIDLFCQGHVIDKVDAMDFPHLRAEGVADTVCRILPSYRFPDRAEQGWRDGLRS